MPSPDPIRFTATPGAVARRYRDAELGHRVATATPHELVAMLYDGARVAAVAAERALRLGDTSARLRQVTRALAILDGLDATLDHGRGGTVARALAAAYAQVRALLIAANSEGRADLFAAAAEQIGTIAEGWTAIVPRERSAA